MTEPDHANDAVRLIASSYALKNEVAAVVDRLEVAAKPIDPVALVQRLIELAPIYGIKDLAPEEWETLFAAYIEALRILPPEAIEEGILEWNRTGAFFPKPGEIYTRAAPHAALVRTAAWRARKAADWVEAHPPRMTPEERARQKAEAIRMGWLNPDGTPNLKPKHVGATPDDEVI